MTGPKIVLKRYQRRKVDHILKKLSEGNEVPVEAPTGAGKTIIMTSLMEEFVKAHQGEYAYIWATPRKDLPRQSMEKFDRYFAGSGLISTIFRDDVSDRLEPDHMWFVNWEYLIKVVDREGESVSALKEIIGNTRMQGLKVMLIIDESHWGAESATPTKTKHAISIISPDKKIHVTATPKSGLRDDEPVTHDEARSEGMLVNAIFQNKGMANQDIQVNDKLVEEGIKMQKSLKARYDQKGIVVNPLLMIQVPNATDGDNAISRTTVILESHGITRENGKLVVWTAEEEMVESDIRDNSSPIDVLIFKQAASLGWDCPRAQILVALRKLKTDSFGTQTLGRIIRTPEQRHYGDDDLDASYLYSAADTLSDSDKDTISNILNTRQMRTRPEIDATLDLPQYKILTTRLEDHDAQFVTALTEMLLEVTHNGKNPVQNMVHTVAPRTQDVPSSRVLNTNVKSKHHDMSEDTATLRSNENDLAKIMEAYVKGIIRSMNLNVRFDSRVAANLVRQSLHTAFRRSGYDTECSCMVGSCTHYNDYKILTIITGADENMRLLMPPITHAVGIIDREIAEASIEAAEIWNIQEWQLTNVSEKQEYMTSPHPGVSFDYTDSFSKYLMRPAYIKIDSLLELNFCRFVNGAKNVEWWYKNDVTRDSFRIPYFDEGLQHEFFPDFIVKMKDDSVGIFDTKDGHTLESAAPKANALADYIARHPDKNVWGGIVTHLEIWRVHGTNPFSHNPSDTGWRTLDLNK